MTAVSIPGLHPSVVAAIPSVFAPWEGQALPYPYTDSKGYLTTGTGNMIESNYMALPWRHGADGPLASPAEVQAMYSAVKGAWPGVQSTASQSLTDLRLNKSDLDALMLKTIAGNQQTLMREYPNFAHLPADAQLALHSISWAWGPAFAEVKWGADGVAFKDAIAKKDFNRAAQIMKAASAHEEQINPGIIKRDNGNVVMFANAAKNRLMPAKLYYPGAVGVPWGTLLLAAAGGIGGFLLGGPLGSAVGVGAALGAGHVAKAGMPAVKIPGLHLGPVDPKAVQTKLNALGYRPALTVDGDLGPRSQAAIKWLQSARGLPATGQVDAATRKALGV